MMTQTKNTVSDITDSANEAVFSTAFIKNIFATKINADFINILYTLLVGSGNTGIEINGVTGEIKSTNFIPGVSGARIRSNGDAEFNKIRARGHIDAESGTFAGELNGASGLFNGYLQVGDAWDSSGFPNNPNRQGGIYSTGGRTSVIGMYVYGTAAIGYVPPGFNWNNEIFIHGPQFVYKRDNSVFHTDRHIHQTCTMTQLRNLLNTFNFQYWEPMRVPVTGTIVKNVYISGPSGGSYRDEILIISGMDTQQDIYTFYAYNQYTNSNEVFYVTTGTMSLKCNLVFV